MNKRQAPGAEEQLARSSPRGRTLFRLVRTLLDELEETTPWRLLYAPSNDSAELTWRLDSMLERIEEVPAAVAAALAEVAAAAANDDDRLAAEEAKFYFFTIHEMTSGDRQRLRSALDRRPQAALTTRRKVDHLCELAADLKGKYTSATMSAAAALVGEGSGRGVEFEARLFPEKAEEATRSRKLLEALERAARAHRTAVSSFPWSGVLASWRQLRPIDRYALGGLVSLRAHLQNLLTVANRRALYSGDYQFLRTRESELGAALRELEEIHIQSLEAVPGASRHQDEQLFARLEELLLEVAAVLDVELVREHLGEGAMQELRAGRLPAGKQAPPPAGANGAGGRHAKLVALIAEEDLKTFMDLLVGAVRKRASIAKRELEPSALSRAATAEQDRRGTVESAPPLPVRLDPRAGRAFAERLERSLARITSEENPHWRAFVMVHKLQLRLGTLPPALLREIEPFLAEMDGDLLPILAEAGAAGAVPAGAVETLRACTARLSAQDASRPDAAREMAGDLARVIRLLGSLRAAAEALRLQ